MTLFQSSKSVLAKKTAVEAFAFVTKLGSCMFRECVEPQEYELQLALSWLRANLLAAAVAYMDVMHIESGAELQQFFVQWWAINGGMEPQNVHQWPKTTGGLSGSTCYSCGKTGHIAKYCRSARKEQTPVAKVEPVQDGHRKGRTCFVCNNPDHLAVCPLKEKGAGAKSERVKFAKVQTSSHLDEGEANVIMGKVDGVESPFVLDSGASISVVPETLVKSNQYTGESVCVGNANGGRKSCKVVVIDIQF